MQHCRLCSEGWPPCQKAMAHSGELLPVDAALDVLDKNGLNAHKQEQEDVQMGIDEKEGIFC